MKRGRTLNPNVNYEQLNVSIPKPLRDRLRRLASDAEPIAAIVEAAIEAEVSKRSRPANAAQAPDHPRDR